MAITETWLKANAGRARPSREERLDREGFGVRITPKGKVVFQMRYRYERGLKRLDLGSYPLISLKDARAEHQRLRGALEQGHDPKIVRSLEKHAIRNAATFEDMFREWYEKYCKRNKKGHREILRSFEIYVFPKLGSLPAEKLTLHHWLPILEDLARTRPGIGERVLTNGKQVMKFGVKRRLIPANPLADFKAQEDLQIRKKVRSRALSPEEIRQVWRAIDASRMSAKNRLFMKLCLVYGCRNSELRLSRKSDFDFKKMVWTVPPENHKLGKATGKPLVRPITPETEPLIREAAELSGESEYLFTNNGTTTPMGKSASLALPYNVMQWLRRHEGYEMKHWSIHDLRKTARTNFSTLTQPHVAEIMLGHKLPGSWQVYDQHEYLSEQNAAYSAWCQRLQELTAQRADPG